MVLNFFQYVPTPHNNTLISEFKNSQKSQLNLWYAAEKLPKRYDYKEDLANKYFKAKIYGIDKISWGAIRYFLSNRNENYLVVGWMNPTTRLLVIIACLLRLPINMWFVSPNTKNLYS